MTWFKGRREGFLSGRAGNSAPTSAEASSSSSIDSAPDGGLSTPSPQAPSPQAPSPQAPSPAGPKNPKTPATAPPSAVGLGNSVILTPPKPPLPAKRPGQAGLSLSQRLHAKLDQTARNAPTRLALITFSSIILLVTTLLSLPIATADGHHASFADALFNAVSAVCVTGLASVDTAVYWSDFGHVVMAMGVMVGGWGVMTIASIFGLAVSRRIGLTQRMLAASEKSTKMGEVASLIKTVIIASWIVEAAITACLLPRTMADGDSFGRALWEAVFMSISIFNNAGFVILPEGLVVHAGDWLMVTPMAWGAAIGAIGFPVILDVSANWRRPRRWNLHSKLTIATYLSLAVLGGVIMGIFEWNNPQSLGPYSNSTKLLTTILNSVNGRSSGLATIPYDNYHEHSWFWQDIMMFIGGGSASTSGGIKVTTLAIMLLAIRAEARGDRDMEAFGHRIETTAVRLAVAVVTFAGVIVAAGTLLLLQMTDYPLSRCLFEAISAFGTVGLSTGITTVLPDDAKYVLSALMFIGRVGTVSFAAALALRDRQRVIRLPADRPLIG